MNHHEKRRQAIIDLLTETGKAHHEAFRAVDGDDPEWPIWYAERLQQPLGELLETEFTRSRLVLCLMTAEFERSARDADAEWAPYYADHFLERFRPSESTDEDKLALYYFDSCPFCVRVRAAIERLGLDVELRNIHDDPERWDQLVAARGRATVPVLKIDSADGSEHWMPESADIIRYLEKTYG